MLMLLNKIKKSKLGYTLTELIVVISVLGILAVVATPFISDYVTKAKDNSDTANAKVMEDILKRYVAKNGTLPTDANIPAIVGLELNPIPASQSGKKFVFVKATGTVKVTSNAAGTGEVEITTGVAPTPVP